MTVHGADAVRQAVSESGVSAPELHIDPEDMLTPLARELAAEHGVRVVIDQPGTPLAPSSAPAAPPSPSPVPPAPTPAPGTGPRHVPAQQAGPSGPPSPPSPALFRRGAPLDPALRPQETVLANSDASRVRRVIVVGAGHVGMITAMRLAEADLIDEVVLVDIADGLAAGIALDLAHTAPLLGFDTRVRGVSRLEEAGPAEYVVITAGKPRQPGMSRSDLVSTNAAIVGDVAARIAATSPAAVLVVVTNPLDEMTHHAWRASGFPPQRVLGMAGVLDTSRFRALVGLTGIARADAVDGVALGSHGAEMLIPLSQARAAGRPVAGQLPAETVDGIVNRTRDSGAEVVGLLKSGSAFMAPGTSAAHMVLAMVRDSHAVVPATVRATGEYGLHDVYVGLPARLCRGGLAQIVELALSADETAELRSAAARISERVDSLESVTAAGS
jgi:malate dehydrogenase